jgi:nucleotide-binding universal stress UspA family protein
MPETDTRSTIRAKESLMKALLAIDGSSESVLALETTASLTWPPGAQLEVLTVLPTESEWYGGPWEFGVAYVPSDDVRDRLRIDREALLERAVERLRRPGIRVAARLVTGRAASVIVDVAQEIGADIVILGARGHGAIERAFLGSVSAEVVDQTHCSVLVARTPSARRILIGTDGSDVATSAIAFVGGSRLFESSTARIIYAVDVDPSWWMGLTPGNAAFAVDPYVSVVDEGRVRGDKVTSAAATLLRSDGLDTSTVVHEGPAAAAIVREARTWNADLVVVGTRGNGLMKRLLLGSTARSVLNHAAASVLIARRAVKAVPHTEDTSSEPVEAVHV